MGKTITKSTAVSKAKTPSKEELEKELQELRDQELKVLQGEINALLEKYNVTLGVDFQFISGKLSYNFYFIPRS